MSNPQFDLDAWAAGIIGKRLDLDNAPARHPDQCHDVFLSYLVALGGSLGDGHAPGTEYTDQVWRNFPTHRPGLAKLFTKHDASNVQRGDVVFWSAFAGVGGLPHVAIATGPPVNGYVPCITQNPNPVEYARLTLHGALGVLRPIKSGEPEMGYRILNLRETTDGGKTVTPKLFFDGGPGVGIKHIQTPKHVELLQRFIADPAGGKMYPAEIATVQTYLKP